MHSLWRLCFAFFENSFWVWEFIFKTAQDVQQGCFCWFRLLFFFLLRCSFDCKLTCLPRVWVRPSLWGLLDKWDFFCYFWPFRLFRLKEVLSRVSHPRNINHGWGLRELFYLTLLLFDSSIYLRVGLAELRRLPLHGLRANRLNASQGYAQSLVFNWFWGDFWWRLLTLRLRQFQWFIVVSAPVHVECSCWFTHFQVCVRDSDSR